MFAELSTAAFRCLLRNPGAEFDWGNALPQHYIPTQAPTMPARSAGWTEPLQLSCLIIATGGSCHQARASSMSSVLCAGTLHVVQITLT